MLKTKPLRILVAPLDWGLGHTTRCVPLIKWLRAHGYAVIVAGNSWQRSFIEKIFSGIEIIDLEGYNVRYSWRDILNKTKVLLQVPAICGAVKREHEWIRENKDRLQLDAIISDNRYGLFLEGIPSVIITHQLQVLSGLGAAADRIVQNLHYKYLSCFNEVWVPDVQGGLNLGGKLSHPAKLPEHTTYIGLLSQLEGVQPAFEISNYILVLLSGAEPQRTRLANLLWLELLNYKGNVVFVAGTEVSVAPGPVPGNFKYYSRKEGKELSGLIAGASLVVCRSGYSTLMDLILLGKRAIIIPTPGQTEQEYLAAHLHNAGIFMTCKQSEFNLKKLELAKDFPYKSLELKGAYLDHENVLLKWTEKIRN